MVREAIGIGDTTEAALAAACAELGIEPHDANFEILELPVKKTLGLFGGSPAKVRVTIEDSPAEVAAEYLQNVLRKMGAQEITVEVREVEGGAVLTLKGDDSGLIIGHHGGTLDALQYLTGLVANHVRESYYRITLDTGNYREKREKTLTALAGRVAEKAVATGKKYALEPMNPYERRIIHTAVQEVEGAASWSEGENADRHVVIGPEGSQENGRIPLDYRAGQGHGGRPQQRYGSPQRGGRPPRREARENNRGGRRQDYQKPQPTAPREFVPSQRASKKDDGSAPLYGRIDLDR